MRGFFWGYENFWGKFGGRGVPKYFPIFGGVWKYFCDFGGGYENIFQNLGGYENKSRIPRMLIRFIELKRFLLSDMKFLKNFRLRRAKLTPDTSLENFRRRHASFVFSTYDCKNAVPAAGSWHFSSNDIYRFLQTGDMVSKRLYKHWILHLHVLQYLVETSLWQGLLNVERCIGAVQKWRHWGREGGKISRSRLLLFKTSRLSAPLASTLVKIKPFGDIPGGRFSQWGSPVKNIASLVIVKFHYITLFLLFHGEKMVEKYPQQKFQSPPGHLAGIF